ncbi:MAG: hypothetical protein KAX80_01950 [Planctomycetes bacterium]|nr:hypothetical protein [Planctomycetota bacterium]
MATLSLRDLPELPANSVIQVEETPEGLELRWLNGRGNVVAKYGLTVFMMFWLGMWARGGAFAIRELLDEWGSKGTMSVFLALLLALWLLAAGLVIALVIATLTPRRPEVLALESACLRHRDGTPPFEYGMRQWWRYRWLWKLLKRLERTEGDKRMVGNVGLDWVGEHQCLTVDVGPEQIEIGEHLREPEREWVAEALQVWLESPGPGGCIDGFPEA